MIQLTLLSGKPYWLNPHQIEHMEANPDTTIVLLSGNRILVKESTEAVIEAIIAYRRLLGVLPDPE